MKKKDEYSSFPIMETELGILAPQGRFYFITRSQIEDYVPGLLDVIKLERLLKDSASWLNSNAFMSLFIYIMGGLLEMSPFVNFALSLVAYVIWYFQKRTFIYVFTNQVIRVLSNDLFIYVMVGVFLTYLGMAEQYLQLGLGVALFFLVKPPLFRMLLVTIEAKVFSTSMVSEEDKVLNSILIKFALAEGIMTSNLKDMENRLFEIIHYNRNRKK